MAFEADGRWFEPIHACHAFDDSHRSASAGKEPGLISRARSVRPRHERPWFSSMAERSAVDRETMVRSHQPGPDTYRCSSVAERRLPNPCVGGSIPPTGATILFRSSALGVCTRLLSGPRLVRIQRPERDVRLAVRPPRSQRGYIGSNPIRRTIIPHVLFGKPLSKFPEHALVP